MKKKIFRRYKSKKQHSIDIKRARGNKRLVAEINALQLKDQIEKLEMLEHIKRMKKEMAALEDDEQGWGDFFAPFGGKNKVA